MVQFESVRRSSTVYHYVLRSFASVSPPTETTGRGEQLNLTLYMIFNLVIMFMLRVIRQNRPGGLQGATAPRSPTWRINRCEHQLGRVMTRRCIN